ncbi:MAG: cation:proton antiporter [Syntrophomonadaceae bacterium]
MDQFTLNFFWLMLMATAVAMLGRFIKIPYTIALVLCGLAIGLLGLFPGIHLNPDLLFAIFLPPILFDAGININLGLLRKQWLTITIFAMLGTTLATMVVAGATYYAIGLPFICAMLFGAIISPTDPISVLAIFQDLGTDEELSNLIEAESLFNDGIAVVLFIVISSVVAGQAVTLTSGLFTFVTSIGGGLFIGVGIGGIASRITREYDDHLLEIMLTTVVAFGSYLAAEHFHFSGVFAVVAASLVVGNYGMTKGMSSFSQMAVLNFWEYIAFAVNSVVFLLVGLEEAYITSGLTFRLVLIAIVAVLLGRIISVYGLGALLSAAGKKIPPAWRFVQVWSGLRGALSMALVLGLDPALPYRSLLINMTFAVVLFSLVVQGLTIKPLLQRLGLFASKSG